MIKIYNMDCLIGMQHIPPNSIDLIITDPPYGENVGYGRNKKKILGNESIEINYRMLEICYFRLKNNSSVYLFTNWKKVDKIKNFVVSQRKYKIKTILTIVKNNIGMGQDFRNQYELCFVLEKGKPKYNFKNFSTVQQMGYIEHNEDTHPHQKDVNLIRKLIEHSSKQGDLILDPFMGSGTTAVACKQLNRNFIGFEIDKRYYEIAKQRLEQDTLHKWEKLNFPQEMEV